MRSGLKAALAPLLASTVLAGCGADRPPVGAAPAAPTAGPVTVFAAASLTEAFTDVQKRLPIAHPGLSVTFSFAGSQQLVSQVEAGAPADVVATADQSTMQKLVSANLVETPQRFARNRLEMVVARGNPRALKGLADLGRPDLKVVLADPSVPAGRYARQVLDAQGIRVSPVSLELDVRAALRKVEEGEADASVVYATDVLSAGSRVTGVVIPAAQNQLASYRVAVVKAASHRAQARAFVEQLVGGVGQESLRARGFLPP